IGHARDAIDLLFERRGDGVGNDLSARSGVNGAYDDLRRGDVRKLRYWQQEEADAPRQNHNDGNCRRKYRTLNKEADHSTPPQIAVPGTHLAAPPRVPMPAQRPKSDAHSPPV